MDFETINWVGSELQKIKIEYDLAVLNIWNNTLQKTLEVECTGLAGITNLCVWEGMIIVHSAVIDAYENEDAFVKQLLEKYDKDYDCFGRLLNKGMWKLSFELSNHMKFSVYCQNIEVKEVGENLKADERSCLGII